MVLTVVSFITHSADNALTDRDLETLIENSPLTGISLSKASGSHYQAGDTVESPHSTDAPLRKAPRTEDGTIDLSWASDPLFSDYQIMARVDVSKVSSELVAFVFRILGLSLLIAVFVTAVTMFVVDRMMLSSLLNSGIGFPGRVRKLSILLTICHQQAAATSLATWKGCGNH